MPIELRVEHRRDRGVCEHRHRGGAAQHYQRRHAAVVEPTAGGDLLVGAHSPVGLPTRALALADGLVDVELHSGAPVDLFRSRHHEQNLILLLLV